MFGDNLLGSNDHKRCWHPALSQAQTAAKISYPQTAQLEGMFCAGSENPPMKKHRVSSKAVKYRAFLLIIKLQKNLQPPPAVSYVLGSVTIIPNATSMGIFSLSANCSSSLERVEKRHSPSKYLALSPSAGWKDVSALTEKQRYHQAEFPLDLSPVLQKIFYLYKCTHKPFSSGNYHCAWISTTITDQINGH